MKKLYKLPPDSFGLFFFLLFSIWYCVAAIELGIGKPSHPGPGFMPLVIGFFMATLTITALYKTLRARGPSNQQGIDSLFPLPKLRNPTKVYAAIVVYALLLPYLGFLISTSLVMFFLFKYILPQSFIIAVIAMLLTVTLSYGIFVLWLGCQYPSILPF